MLKPNDRTFTADQVRLIGPEGEQMDVVPLAKARELAQGAGLDLVLVSDRSTPPVVRIMNFGKLQYEQKKNLKTQRKNSAAQKLKEVKFHVNIDSHDYETKIKINKRELLSCIDRATLLVKEGDKKPIIMNVTEGNMELKIQSFIGSMNEDIDIEKEGKDILIGFNPKFFIDALRVIDDEEVTLYMVNPKAPCFIKDDQGSYIYLILPVNFNNVAN